MPDRKIVCADCTLDPIGDADPTNMSLAPRPGRTTIVPQADIVGLDVKCDTVHAAKIGTHCRHLSTSLNISECKSPAAIVPGGSRARRVESANGASRSWVGVAAGSRAGRCSAALAPLPTRSSRPASVWLGQMGHGHRFCFAS